MAQFVTLLLNQLLAMGLAPLCTATGEVPHDDPFCRRLLPRGRRSLPRPLPNRARVHPGGMFPLPAHVTITVTPQQPRSTPAHPLNSHRICCRNSRPTRH